MEVMNQYLHSVFIIMFYYFVLGCVSIRESYEFHSVASVGACQQKCESENRGMSFGYRKRNQKVSKVNIDFIRNQRLILLCNVKVWLCHVIKTVVLITLFNILAIVPL